MHPLKSQLLFFLFFFFLCEETPKKFSCLSCIFFFFFFIIFFSFVCVIIPVLVMGAYFVQLGFLFFSQFAKLKAELPERK